MGQASKKKRAKKQKIATNERVVREFFDKTTAPERGLLAGVWYFGEEPELMKPGEKECHEGLAVDIGRSQLQLPAMESLRIMNFFETAGVFTSYRPEGDRLHKVYRFTAKGAAFGQMMQAAQEKAEAETLARADLDAAEQAHKLVTASLTNDDALAELTERLIMMENMLAEDTVPKPGDAAFALALDEMGKAKTYPEDADVVRKARDILALIEKKRAENAKKEAEQRAGNG